MEEPSSPVAAGRAILVAELLAIGSELTVGETTDTNSGELARSLVAHGIVVNRITALPDQLETVVDAVRTALARADLVITTGGLGPTPDDLTREAIAAVCGESVEVDPRTLTWLQELWARRGIDFPASNVKQAWLIRSATSLGNLHGTAPGWWVDRPDGRVIVLLPGPPREMVPMWRDVVLPRLRNRGVGDDMDVRTLRLTGIGESHVVDRLGEAILRRTNPIVATYARHDAVDVRISAHATDGSSAAELTAAAEAEVMAILGEHVWARGDTTWPAAIGEVLSRFDWSLSLSERGSDGALVALVRGLKALRYAEVSGIPGTSGAAQASGGERELQEAERVRAAAGTDVGMAVTVEELGKDTTVLVGIVSPAGRHAERRVAFMGGRQGADRAAIAAAAVLLAFVRSLADR